MSTKRRKAYQTKSLLDFSKDHKFKLNGENIEDHMIRIQIKRATSPLQKSTQHRYFSFLVLLHNNIFLLDVIVAEMEIGPDMKGSGEQHWSSMITKPEDRIFHWHKVTLKSNNTLNIPARKF